MKKQNRHGDLLIEEGKIPKEAKKCENVLAYGEVTGHAHRVSGKAVQVYEYKKTRYIDVQETAQLTHEEHDTISLQPGQYIVIRQVEYTPAGLRQVQD
jgi:hypothetical protein